MVELVFRSVVGLIEIIWLFLTRGQREQAAQDSVQAEVDRVNAWLRTQPNSTFPKKEESAP